MATKEEYALLAAAAYTATDPELQRPIPPGWSVDLDPIEDFLGFDAAVYRNDATGEIVIAFTGTTDWMDWVTGNAPGGLGAAFTPQILGAIKLYSAVQEMHPDAEVSFTGHSLGGGIASVLAVLFDREAVVFNPAPFEESAMDLAALGTYFSYYSALQPYHGHEIEDTFADYVGSLGSLLSDREQNVESHVLAGEVLDFVAPILGLETIAGYATKNIDGREGSKQ